MSGSRMRLGMAGMALGLLCAGCITKRVYEPVVLTPSGDALCAQPQGGYKVVAGGNPERVPYFWSKGYWVFSDRRWIWIPGSWQIRARPGAEWGPGCWQRTPEGWRWVPGEWK